ncbi:MAG: MFS transporter [Bifidobacteriaceae bacterium]|jgi:MFS family permease|nr:MFS transporter [Bifidobacteriaceae bacterium]
MKKILSSGASRILVGVIGVEFVSGVLGAYYTPLIVPLARSVGLHDSDWNWVEAAQTLFAAVAIPVLTKLGDRFGHKKALLASIVITAAAAWWVVAGGGFVPVICAFSLMSVSAVWLALELALLRSALGETTDSAERISSASAALIVAFMFGSVGAAIFGGQFFTGAGGWDALQTAVDSGQDPAANAVFARVLRLTLLVPATGVTILIPLVALLVPESRRPARRRGDRAGLASLIGILVLVVGGLSLVKIQGVGRPLGWIVIALGLALIYPFVRHQLAAAEPTIDPRLLRRAEVWPYQAASLLLGIGYTATQIPLVTFASTDPAKHGYGLAADSGDVSIVMAVMIIAISLTAGFLTAFGSRLDKLRLIRVAPFVHAGEFVVFLFLHTQLWHAYLAVAIGGVGAGILIAWLPAAAANAAPRGKTATLVGLISLGRMVGTALGSAVFAVVLATVGRQSATAAALPGYLTVFAIAIGSSLLGGTLLLGARDPARAGTEPAIARRGAKTSNLKTETDNGEDHG